MCTINTASAYHSYRSKKDASVLRRVLIIKGRATFDVLLFRFDFADKDASLRGNPMMRSPFDYRR
jgi:hypothetical protein